MSALDDTPETLQFLNPLNFHFSIKRCPAVNFFVQKIQVPAVSLPTSNIPSPFIPIPNPATRMVFERTFSIDFKVDENLINYSSLYHWLRDTGSPVDYAEYNMIYPGSPIQDTGIHSEISLIILTGLANPNIEVIYHDSFPTRLSGMTFASTPQDVNYVTASCDFTYLYYDMNPVT